MPPNAVVVVVVKATTTTTTTATMLRKEKNRTARQNNLPVTEQIPCNWTERRNLLSQELINSII
jgi:hypothetical protein